MHAGTWAHTDTHRRAHTRMGTEVKSAHHAWAHGTYTGTNSDPYRPVPDLWRDVCTEHCPYAVKTKLTLGRPADRCRVYDCEHCSATVETAGDACTMVGTR